MFEEILILSFAYICLIGFIYAPKTDKTLAVKESESINYFPEITEEITLSELDEPIAFNLPTPKAKPKKSLNTLIREESRKKGLTGKSLQEAIA